MSTYTNPRGDVAVKREALVARQIGDLRAGTYAGTGGAEALAAALGVSYATLAAWQRGRNAPSWGNRRKLAALWAKEVPA